MVEIERQVNEAPAVCVIVQWDEQAQRTKIVRFEDENGDVLACSGEQEFARFCGLYLDEVKAAVADCYEAAKVRSDSFLK